jgi:plastocyanin
LVLFLSVRRQGAFVSYSKEEKMYKMTKKTRPKALSIVLMLVILLVLSGSTSGCADPEIRVTKQPVGGTAVASNPYTLSVAAEVWDKKTQTLVDPSEYKMTYSWWLNGSPLSNNADKATYTAIHTAGTYKYHCMIRAQKEGLGEVEVNTNTVTVTFQAPTSVIKVTKRSYDTALPVGTAYKMEYKAELRDAKTDKLLSGTIKYQWYVNDKAISGATSASYTAKETKVGMYEYHCMLSAAGARTIETDSVILWYEEAPKPAPIVPVIKVIAQPTGGTVTVGESHTLSLAAELRDNATNKVTPGTIKYQWHVNGQAINGATNASYTAKEGSAGTYTYLCALSADGASPVHVTAQVTFKEKPKPAPAPTPQPPTPEPPAQNQPPANQPALPAPEPPAPAPQPDPNADEAARQKAIADTGNPDIYLGYTGEQMLEIIPFEYNGNTHNIYHSRNYYIDVGWRVVWTRPMYYIRFPEFPSDWPAGDPLKVARAAIGNNDVGIKSW